MTTGFLVSAIFLAMAGVVALTLIPHKMRQAQIDDEPDWVDEQVEDLPGFLPELTPEAV